MKKFKVQLDGQEVEVVRFDEATAYANEQGANARLAERNTQDNLKNQITALQSQVNELQTAKTELDALKPSVDSLKNDLSAQQRFVNVFKMFEGKVPLSAVEDFVHIPMLKELDFSNAEAVQSTATSFQQKYPMYFSTDGGNTTPAPNNNNNLNPMGGNGGGSTVNTNGAITKVGDLAGKSRAEINALWDTLPKDG